MNRTDITQSISRALRSLPMPIEARLYGSEARADSEYLQNYMRIIINAWKL